MSRQVERFVRVVSLSLTRQNMYIANHAYAIVDKPLEEGQREIKELIAHASQPKYVVPIHWNDPGDLSKSPAVYKRTDE